MEFDMNRFPVAFLAQAANLIPACTCIPVRQSYRRMPYGLNAGDLFARPFGSGSGNSLYRRFDLKDLSPLLYIQHAPIYWLARIMFEFSIS